MGCAGRWRLLAFAAVTDLKCLGVLIEAGADLNSKSQDVDCSTALHLAAQAGEHEAVATLLAAGASVRALDWEAHGPLTRACKSASPGYARCVFHLARPTLDGKPEWWAGSFFACLARRNQAAGIRELAAAGFDPNIRSKEVEEALPLSAWCGCAEAVEALLDVGCLPCDATTGRSLAAENARGQGHEALARMIEARILASKQREALEEAVACGPERAARQWL